MAAGRQKKGWIVGLGFVISLGLGSGCSDGEPSATTPTTSSTESPGKAAPVSARPAAAPIPSAVSLPNPSTPEKPIAESLPARSVEEMTSAGRSLYNANCIVCHHLNPAEEGVLGPAIAGASAELIEARVLRGEYPEGYAPKRPTKVMIPLPHLAPRLDELVAYLNSVD